MPGLEFEKNWGLFFPDQTSVYNLDITGMGTWTWSLQVQISLMQMEHGVLLHLLLLNLTYRVPGFGPAACGPGNVDCSAIQPSQPGFEPDNLASHASYAFNSYYQQNGASNVACNFGGNRVRTNKNPTKRRALAFQYYLCPSTPDSRDTVGMHNEGYDNCLYVIAGSNKTATSNMTTSPTTASAGSKRCVWIPSCLLLALLSFLWSLNCLKTL